MPQRWHSFAEPAHDLEARALRYVTGLLPDEDPHAGWSNFTFTTRDGAMYEVDALVLTPAGLFLVEVKSYTGSLVAGPQHLAC